MKKYFFWLLCAAALALTGCNENNPENNNGNKKPIPITGVLNKSESGSLNGAFSIAEDKYVIFSMGNLRYQTSANRWHFSDEQYDMIGDKNVVRDTVWRPNDKYNKWSSINYSFADVIDLFDWGTGNNPTFHCNALRDCQDAYSTFTDWGSNPISNGGNEPNRWRTLTYGEWTYLIRSRPNATNLFGVAVVNGVNGLILLPDAWKCPTDIVFKSGCIPYEIGFNNRSLYSYHQSFTKNEWQLLEAAGAVFLPAAGRRQGSYIPDLIGEIGVYWHSSKQSISTYDFFGFYCYGTSTEFYGAANYGLAVRLVQDIN